MWILAVIALLVIGVPLSLLIQNPIAIPFVVAAAIGIWLLSRRQQKKRLSDELQAYREKPRHLKIYSIQCCDRKSDERRIRMGRAITERFNMTDLDRNNLMAIFHGTAKSPYVTTLEFCTCPDYKHRKGPCKHMYRLALENDIDVLPVPFYDSDEAGSAYANPSLLRFAQEEHVSFRRGTTKPEVLYDIATQLPLERKVSFCCYVIHMKLLSADVGNMNQSVNAHCYEAFYKHVCADKRFMDSFRKRSPDNFFDIRRGTIIFNAVYQYLLRFGFPIPILDTARK